MEVKSPFEPAPQRRYPQRGPMPVSLPQTMPALLERCVERFGDRVFLPRMHSRGGEAVTFARLSGDVARTAAGLAALGIGHGDRVGLIGENRYQWLVADLAISRLGAVDVPRGVDTAPSELAFILSHSGSVFAFVENDHVAREIEQHRAELPPLRGLCSLADHSEVEGVMVLPDLMAAGDAWLRRNPESLAALADRVQPDDLLTIVYTSGTTAEPKGVMLTHGNVLSNVWCANQVLGFGPEDRFLSVLPPWHMYERMMDYVALATGAEVVYTDRRRLKDDLRDMRPTLFAAVPRIWESLHDGIVSQVQKLPERRRRWMDRTLWLCRQVGASHARLHHRVLHALLRRTLRRRLQTVTGGRLRLAVSGGGALPPHVDELLLGLGIPLLNGYGLTETSPVVAVRDPRSNRSGTIGRPLPDTDVEIRDEHGRPVPAGAVGTIWIRGPQVMRGYYKNPERTAAVLIDGWFNSGDLGSIGADGQIRITGRAKDTIVLAGGENVEPEPLETAIKISPLVEQAVVVGQDQKALGALLVANLECLEQRVSKEHWQIEGPLILGREVHDLLRKELDRQITRANGFRACERIAAFKVLHEPLTPDNGLLTQTLKVKRHVVAERFGPLIAEMFERG